MSGSSDRDGPKRPKRRQKSKDGIGSRGFDWYRVSNGTCNIIVIYDIEKRRAYCKKIP